MSSTAVILAMACFLLSGACVTMYIVTGLPILAGLAVVNAGFALVNLVTYRNTWP